MYRLVFLTGTRKGRRLAVSQGTLLIGRDHDVHLDLREDDEVSRHHAHIEERADGCFLTDLGGRNPTEVNGQVVRGSIKLKAGDQIQLGRTLMEFQAIEAARGDTRRAVSMLQSATFGLVIALLVAQVAYWIFFPRLTRMDAAKAAPKPEQTIDPIEAELARALAQAAADERAPDLPPPATPATPAGSVTGEVETLRAAVAELRKQVAGLATTPSNPPPAAAETNVAAASEAERLRAERAAAAAKAAEAEAHAKELLADAVALEQRGKPDEAVLALARAQQVAPDFVPAYVERARMLEKRGKLTEAADEWTQVLTRSNGTPLYDQAAAERRRLARAEIMQALDRPAPPGPAATPAVPGFDPAPTPTLPRLLRIASIERERFEAGRDYDEMRVAHAALRAHPGLGDVEVNAVAVTVTFYDRDTKSGRVHPTRAVAPRTPFRVEGLWKPNEEKTVTAAYVVAKNFRRDEEQREGERSEYEGVRVRVFYRDRLQDEDAVPKDLLKQPAPPPPEKWPAQRAPAADDPNAPVRV